MPACRPPPRAGSPNSAADMLVALLLAAVAAVSAGLALQYTWVFYSSVRTRHPKRFGGVSLFGSSEEVVVLNDADIYAAWSLARMNLIVAVVCLVFGAVLGLAMRQS